MKDETKSRMKRRKEKMGRGEEGRMTLKRRGKGQEEFQETAGGRGNEIKEQEG
jgi:hypothetical protein